MRQALGYVGGLIMIASGCAHSLLGWGELQRVMQAAAVPAEISKGLAIPWHFAGMAMIVFGLLAAWLTLRRERSDPSARSTLAAIGAAYVLFAGWALVAVEADAFLLIFMAPGLMLVASSQMRG